LLADEPTSSLDPKTARDVTDILLDEAGRRGATLVFCSHWVSLARERVDRVIGIRGGRVVLDAAPDQVDDDALDRLYRGSDEKV
ncbi:MAG TPA: phosphonate ABC transporter ATP-binding protein, partial [Kofleriaceae bacterium]|nr:phosphonate ABC transporter ATP-binding protein [Kofleriaceae bacterium]